MKEKNKRATPPEYKKDENDTSIRTTAPDIPKKVKWMVVIV